MDLLLGGPNEQTQEGEKREMEEGKRETLPKKQNKNKKQTNSGFIVRTQIKIERTPWEEKTYSLPRLGLELRFPGEAARCANKCTGNGQDRHHGRLRQ